MKLFPQEFISTVAFRE